MIRKFLFNRTRRKPVAYTFVDHLEELRWVIIKSSIAILLCSVIGFIYMDFFFDTVMMGPAHKNFLTYKILCHLSHLFHLGNTLCLRDIDLKLQSTTMSSQFLMSFSIALAVGMILAFPYIIRQIWLFIEPALIPQEKKNTRFAAFSVSILFFTGMLFGYFVIAPYSIQFFANYTLSPNIENRFLVSDYISNILQISIGTGLLFQLPLIIYILGKTGTITKKRLRQSRKYAIIIILIIAAVIAPPDVISQLIIGIPIYLLYEASIFIAERTQKEQTNL